MTLGQVASEIRSRSKIPVIERDVERILAALRASWDIWRIIDLADVPIGAVCEGLRVLREVGWVTWDEGRIHLTPAGEEACQALHIAEALELRCAACGGTGVELGPVTTVASAFRNIARARPKAIQKFDQGYITVDGTLARIAFMWSRGDLWGKDLVVLGDDDLVSVAAALTRVPRRVVALDIDERIVGFVEEVARAEDLGIEVVRHDLREPLPEEFLSRFDTFVCDPPESLRGFLAFVHRGLCSLRGPGSAGYLGLTRREASLEKWRQIQQKLLGVGTVITDLRDDFHTYQNWPYMERMRAWAWLPVQRTPGRDELWYRSALIRIEVVEKPRVPNERLSGDIFEDLEAATT